MAWSHALEVLHNTQKQVSWSLFESALEQVS